MGTWGYGINENDTFCEIIDFFRRNILCGQTVEDTLETIQREYEDEVDASIAALAITECLWRVGKLTGEDLNKVRHIIETGIDTEYWIKLGADEEFIQNRKMAITDFLNRISVPAAENQIWHIELEESALQKGLCFWYRYRGNLYGAVVLETIKSSINYYLILVSERMDMIPQTVSQILAASVYTAAWFAETNLLNPKRFHIIGKANVSRNYKNKYGIKIEPEKLVYITNCGQTRTWGHSFRQISFDNVVMREFLES